MALWAAAAVTAVGAYSSYQQGKAAENAANQASGMSMEQLAFAKERWQMYTEKVLPMEMEAAQLGISAQKLALQRGEIDFKLYQDYYAPLQIEAINEARNMEPQYERVTSDAASDVSQQFDRQQGIQERNQRRMGVRPDSGRAESLDRTGGLVESATRAEMINRAREGERDRVETSKFNRMASMLGRQPVAQGMPGYRTPVGLQPNMDAAYNNATGTAMNMASMYGQGSAATMQAGINAGATYYSMFNNKGGQQKPAVQNNYSGYSSGSGWYNQGAGSDVTGYHNTDFYHGGLVEGPPGRDRVPATIDGQPGAHLTTHEYVIPNDVVQKVGTNFLDELVKKYHKGEPMPSRGGLRERAA